MPSFFDSIPAAQRSAAGAFKIPDTPEELLTTHPTTDSPTDPVEKFVRDLQAARAAYDALTIPTTGAQWAHTPGTGLVPEAEVRDVIERLGGHIPA